MRRFSLLLAVTLAASLALAAGVGAQSTQYYVLDGFGGVHAGGGAAVIVPGTPYFGFDVAQDIAYVPFGSSGSHGDGILVLDSFGGVHRGGAIPNSSANPRPPYFGFNIARAIVYRNVPPRVVGSAASGAISISTGTNTPLLSQTIQSPDDGYLLVNTSTLVYCNAITGSTAIEVSVGLDSTVGDPSSVQLADVPDCAAIGSGVVIPTESVSITRLFFVSAGPHTVHLLARKASGSSPANASNNSLVVLFVDQNAVGGS